MYSVTYDLSEIASLPREVYAALSPRLTAAVASVADGGAEEWRSRVWKAKLWAGEKEPYAESVSWRMTGALSAEIVSDYKYAVEIERGRPEKDLKRMLQTSRKTRQAKGGAHVGQKYLIIPFRHNVPSASGGTPRSVFRLAKELDKSWVSSMGTRISATGSVVPKASYHWGERLPSGLSGRLSQRHSTDRHAGMVRMETSAGKGKSSAYLTFRVMGEWQSNRWMIGQRPGMRLMEDTAKGIAPLLEKAVNRALGKK
ncbi:MAG: hypothetical protein LBG69_07575 [Zoogloeaceae bacterium]|jgi:hypothetical protein|nr:hypothetical protein [Zoogloeaceae bacterium]